MINMSSIPKIRIFAVLAVLLMAFAPFIVPVENVSAASGDGGTYSYTMTFSSSAANTGTASLTVDGMNPINHPSYNGTTVSGYGSWTWDSNTGYGPFNSFYAAFDLTQGNKFVSVMDPFNLKKGIDGTDYTSRMSSLNIMWVLPTVYVYNSGTTYTLSNDSSSGGIAYAHNIDGHVYKYIAIGVYEGSVATVGSTSVLASVSGATPEQMVRPTMRTYAHNYALDESLDTSTADAKSMMFSYMQWIVYRMCGLILMENWNSQTVVGNGYIVASSSIVTTGSMDTKGPYAGSTGTVYNASSKLFLENSWGGAFDTIDGVVYSKPANTMYIDMSSNPTDSTSGTYVRSASISLISGYGGSLSMNSPYTFGMTTGGTGSGLNGNADKSIVNTESTNGILLAGGPARNNTNDLKEAGINAANFYTDVATGNAGVGRLALAFDKVLEKVSVSASPDQAGWGTVSPASVTVPYASTLTVSGQTITVNGQTMTATPTTSDAQYTYSFVGWYVGSSPLTSGTRATADMTITARFSATLNDYDLTVASNNTDWGTVDVPSIADVPYGTVLTVSGTTMTVNGTTVTATKTPDDAQYTYAFDGWYVGGAAISSTYTVTGDAAITAQFSRTGMEYTIQVVSNNTDWGTVSPEFVYDVPYGSTITTFNNTFRLNGTTVTATPAESTEYNRYLFQSWSVLSGTQVTSDMTITATFERRGTDVTVTIVPNNPDYGSVSVGTFDYVPVGSVIDIVSSTLTIAGNVTTATAAESTLASQFDFAGYFIGAAPITPGAAITSNTVITAVFLETPHLYNVPVRVNDPAYGTVDIGRLENVPYGAVMTVSGTSITVNDTTVTATVADDNEQYRFSWAGWSYRGSTVVSGTTAVSGPSPIIATVDAVLQQYTVTWIIGETIETQTYSYGDWPTHDTPDAPTEGEVFYWWEPRVTHVTGDAEYTAVFGPPHEMPDYTPLVGIVITLLIMAIMFGIYKSGHDITGRDVALAMLALVILLLMIPYMAG